MISSPFIGVAPAAAPIPAQAGIGLRFPHHDLILDHQPDAAWLEVHPENYPPDGAMAELLGEVRQTYPLSLHATGLSLGSSEGIDPDHLNALARLCHRLSPGLVSDHLSWSAAGGLRLPDLLPLPYSHQALAVTAANIDRVQARLGRQLLVENPSAYLAFDRSELSEGEFLGELVDRTGCGVLLDLNNIAVSAGNLGQSADQRLDDMLANLPPAAIGEIHLAGHAVRVLEGGLVLRIDDHGSPVDDQVMNLFQTLIRRIGPRPTLIEWDTAIPPFEVLQAEAGRAQAVLDTLAAPAPEARLAAIG